MSKKLIIALVVLLTVVFALLKMFYPPQEMNVTGRVVIPVINLSLSSNSDSSRIYIQKDGEDAYVFLISKSEVSDFLKSAKSFTANDPAASATVQFKKTLFGQYVDVKVTDFKPGWIQTPK